MKNRPVNQLPDSSIEKRIWPYQNKYSATELSSQESEFLSRDDLPIISVVTPSFNQGQFIEQTIRSVLLQNYPHVEYFVMDGGSTDNTKSVLEKYSTWITDWKVEDDNGQSHAINKGFKRSSGDIVAWLNADDIYLPKTLLSVAKAMVDYPDAGFCFGNWHEIDAKGKVKNTYLSRTPSVLGLLTNVKSYVAQPTLFFKRNALEKIGFIDESLHMVMDFELLLRLLVKYEPIQVDEVLAAYRTHPATKTNLMETLAWAEREIVFQRILSSDNITTDILNLKRSIMGVFFRRSAYEHLRSLRLLKGIRSLLLSIIYNPFQVLDLRLWWGFLKGPNN